MAKKSAKTKEPYLVIARKWRPTRFEDVVGQEETTLQLASMIKEGRIGQAFLFCGPRGVGKTSTARLLAMALNCENGPMASPDLDDPICQEIRKGNDLDVIEIDGASNNSVEEIRDLQTRISLAPLRDRYKIYIIDEVHMLSIAAFNALLKTLEEPPPHVKFIFATTEEHKIPETIISRCQKFSFHRLDTSTIVERLAYILEQESTVEIEPEKRQEILEQIALASEGGMRDAQMMLDQLIALGQGRVTLENTLNLLGLVESSLLEETLENLLQRRTAPLLASIANLVSRGRDIERFIKHLLAYVRSILLMKSGAPAELLGLSDERAQRAHQKFAAAHPEALINIMKALLDMEPKLKGTIPARFLLEFAYIQLTALDSGSTLQSVVNRLEELEKKN